MTFCVVYGLSALDILQTCMVTADAFHWFVFGFGNMNQLDEPFLNSWDVVLIDSVVALIVQSFYCWRIYLLQDSFILPIFIILVSNFCLTSNELSMLLMSKFMCRYL